MQTFFKIYFYMGKHKNLSKYPKKKRKKSQMSQFFFIEGPKKEVGFLEKYFFGLRCFVVYCLDYLLSQEATSSD